MGSVLWATFWHLEQLQKIACWILEPGGFDSFSLRNTVFVSENVFLTVIALKGDGLSGQFLHGSGDVMHHKVENGKCRGDVLLFQKDIDVPCPFCFESHHARHVLFYGDSKGCSVELL